MDSVWIANCLLEFRVTNQISRRNTRLGQTVRQPLAEPDQAAVTPPATQSINTTCSSTRSVYSTYCTWNDFSWLYVREHAGTMYTLFAHGKTAPTSFCLGAKRRQSMEEPHLPSFLPCPSLCLMLYNYKNCDGVHPRRGSQRPGYPAEAVRVIETEIRRSGGGDGSSGARIGEQFLVDLGCGTGKFTREIAPFVQTEGAYGRTDVRTYVCRLRTPSTENTEYVPSNQFRP